MMWYWRLFSLTMVLASVLIMGAVPSPPSTVTRVVSYSDGAQWEWSAVTNANPVTSYKLSMTGTLADGTTWDGATVPASTTSYYVSGLKVGVAYVFSVKAVNSDGDSSAKAAASFTPVAGAGTAPAFDRIPLPTAQIEAATAALAKLGAIQYLAFVLAISLFFSALMRIRRHR